MCQTYTVTWICQKNTLKIAQISKIYWARKPEFFWGHISQNLEKSQFCNGDLLKYVTKEYNQNKPFYINLWFHAGIDSHRYEFDGHKKWTL